MYFCSLLFYSKLIITKFSFILIEVYFHSHINPFRLKNFLSLISYFRGGGFNFKLKNTKLKLGINIYFHFFKNYKFIFNIQYFFTKLITNLNMNKIFYQLTIFDFK